MASVQRKLVHKQFNSPIGLYSDNNVKATLDRELKVLSNGTMGIDFDDTSKPANLQNSAVLRMLEEEENQKRHGRQSGGLKRVAWPPEPEYQSPSRVVPQPQQSPAQDIMCGIDVDKPVLQVLGTKRIPNAEGTSRYRLLVSDGINIISYAMLATQLNSYAVEHKLVDNTIIRIDKYIVSVVSQEKKVVVILELTVLHPGEEVGSKIGSPEHLTEVKPQNRTPAAAAVPEVLPVATMVSKPTAYGNSSNSLNTSNSRMNESMQSSRTGSLNHMTFPIANLSPYQNKWVIKARVTAKTPIRTWSNQKGEGKLFSMDLMDESGQIRATAFKEMVDKYFDMIKIDKVYYISKCVLKPANKQFTTIKNDYEMTFSNDTVVEECHDDTDNVPNVSYNLVPLSQISQMEPNAIVDVAGICREVGEILQFTAKSTGRELKKREITLVDSSCASVSLTLWGQDAETFDAVSQPVIFIKGGKVNEFGGGKSISLVSGSAMKINPDIHEAHKLRGWYDNEGHTKDFSSVSTRVVGSNLSTDWVNFYDVKARNLGSSDKPDYFQCKAIVNLVRTNNCVYKSCPKADCNKKVLDSDNGVYRCEKCQADSTNFKYRLLVNVSIADWTTNRWVTIFSDMAEKMLEKTSEEVGQTFDRNKDELEALFSNVLFKSFIFKLRTKVENYGDSARNKITAVNISPINHKEYNSYLVKNIQALSGIGKN